MENKKNMDKTGAKSPQKANRRDFFNLSVLAAGSAILKPWTFSELFQEFPDAERLGRIAVGRVDIKNKT